MASQSTQLIGPLEKLTPDGERAIHEASLTLLREVGIQVGHEGALELLDENGCDVDRDENLVTFPSSLVEDCIEMVPSSFTLHGRGEDRAVTVGEGSYATSPCGSAPNVLTYEEGRRQSTVADYEKLLKLTHVEDVMTTTGYNHVEPNDVAQEVKHYELLERSIKLSDKPLKGDTWGADRARASIEMAGIANEDPDLSKPYVFATINSVSPRIWDTKMTGGLMEYAKHGQPALLSPAVMASASGPSTLAGTLSLGNAEILAGNVIAQLVNEGTPIVYGLPTSNIDVRFGSFAIGSPEGALCVAFAGQMSRFYDMPSRAGGSLTDAKVPDIQAGAESMLQLFVTIQSGVNLTHHAAGILLSSHLCEKCVIEIQALPHLTAGGDLRGETCVENLQSLVHRQAGEEGTHLLGGGIVHLHHDCNRIHVE